MTTPKYFATASEVATMDFLRIHGIPVPKVYAYSAESDNEVGSEYIIMENASGRSIGHDWWVATTNEERLKILVEFAKLEARLFSIELPAYGSIYYENDLQPDDEKIAITGTRFCVGPAVAWNVWELSRLGLRAGPGTCELRLLTIGFNLTYS
jgi:hypothetical protein